MKYLCNGSCSDKLNLQDLVASMELVVADPNIIPLCQKAFETNTTAVQFKVLI